MKPLWLAITQLDDPAYSAVLARSLGLTFLALVALLGGSVWAVQAMLADVHWFGGPMLGGAWAGWIAGILGTIGVALLALWLFLPTVMLIAALYIDRIAAAVDRRHYPALPTPQPAPFAEQLWEGMVLATQILVLNTVALLLTVFVPGLGWALAWCVSGWAIGRGLFVAVALRRMDRAHAVACYRGRRLAILLPGMILALAASIPGVNLLVPILGTAAMVHVLNEAITWG